MESCERNASKSYKTFLEVSSILVSVLSCFRKWNVNKLQLSIKPEDSTQLRINKESSFQTQCANVQKKINNKNANTLVGKLGTSY